MTTQDIFIFKIEPFQKISVVKLKRAVFNKKPKQV